MAASVAPACFSHTRGASAHALRAFDTPRCIASDAADARAAALVAGAVENDSV